MVLYALLGGLFGLITGSAINAYVWRLHAGKSWVHGRSECSVCGHALAPKDLVPVLSWVMLRGKCRYCHKPIKDHPVVELATAGLFGLSAYALAPVDGYGLTVFVFWLGLLTLMIILAAYDARWLLLPDKVMVPLIAVAFLFTVVTATWSRSPQVLYGAVEAAAIAGGGFWALVAATRGRAMGGGDIKLAFAMGLILGLQATAVALLVAFNVAAAVGLGLIATKRKGRRDQIPFGPFLVLGTIVAFLFGRQIVAAYLQLNGLG